jgi:hypothetical protein
MVGKPRPVYRPHDAERVLGLVSKNQIRLTPTSPPPV